MLSYYKCQVQILNFNFDYCWSNRWTDRQAGRPVDIVRCRTAFSFVNHQRSTTHLNVKLKCYAAVAAIFLLLENISPTEILPHALSSVVSVIVLLHMYHNIFRDSGEIIMRQEIRQGLHMLKIGIIHNIGHYLAFYPFNHNRWQ